jgi:hypothetical protein
MEDRNGIVDIATRYGLHISVLEPLWGKYFLFSTPYHTGSGALKASCAMGNMALFPGKSSRGVALTTHSQLARSRAIPQLPHSACMAC